MADTEATAPPSEATEQNGGVAAATAPQPEPPAEATPTQIIRRSPKALSRRDPFAIAKAVAGSRYFSDTETVEKAVVKIIAGEVIGLDPIAAVQGITVIEGKIGYTGNLIATLVRQHPTYAYKVLERSNENCKLEIFDGDDWQPVEFSVEDAERAGLVKDKSNWEKYPRAMCFNRALTEGVRAYIPDLTAGTPAYTDEEIEEVIDVTPEEEPTAEEAPQLPVEVVAQLGKGIEVVGLDFDEFNVLLGSLGIDAFMPEASINEQLATLTPEQAEALNAALIARADSQDDGEAATDADA